MNITGDVLEEIWKPIKDYENIYEVSATGKVRSLNRIDSRGCKRKGKVISLHKNNVGYFRASLWNSNKVKRCFIHRLVAEAFIFNDNKEKNIIINHKDGNKENNHFENLEWCDYSYNSKHAFSIGLATPTALNKFGKDHNRSIPIDQFDKNYNFIKTYYSSYEVERELGIAQQNISKVCKGKRNYAGGFRWKYNTDIKNKYIPKNN